MGAVYLDRADLFDVLEAIRAFEEEAEVVRTQELRVSINGRLDKNTEAENIRIAIMTPRGGTDANGNYNGEMFNFKKEAYLDLTKYRKLEINQIIKTKRKEYKIVNQENNYDVFQRMELTENEKR